MIKRWRSRGPSPAVIQIFSWCPAEKWTLLMRWSVPQIVTDWPPGDAMSTTVPYLRHLLTARWWLDDVLLLYTTTIHQRSHACTLNTIRIVRPIPQKLPPRPQNQCIDHYLILVEVYSTLWRPQGPFLHLCYVSTVSVIRFPCVSSFISFKMSNFIQRSCVCSRKQLYVGYVRKYVRDVTVCCSVWFSDKRRWLIDGEIVQCYIDTLSW